jgi:putative peptide zinc metalloprotease protein
VSDHSPLPYERFASAGGHHPSPPSGVGRRREPRFRRSDVYTQPIVDGQELHDGLLTRFVAWLRAATTSAGERREAELHARLRASRRPTRTNTIAVVSPKGGVGKTTCTFLLGNVLAAHLRLRVLAVDANRDFGTLASLAPDETRVERSLTDLLADMEGVHSAPELSPYVSPLPTGLHVLAAPERAEAMAEMSPTTYGELLAFLSRYYDVILLDLGTGIIDPLAQFGIQRADQALVVTTPEYVTADKVLGALRYLNAEGGWDAARNGEGSDSERLTVVLNRAPAARSGDRQVIEAAFRRLGIARHIVIPYDDRLRVMLDSATYTLEGLERATRMPIKQLGLAAARKLV